MSLRHLLVICMSLYACSPLLGNDEDFDTVPEIAEQPKGLKDLKKEPIKTFYGDHSLEIQGRLRIESFVGKNLQLLNNKNNNISTQQGICLDLGLDKILVPAKHTFDLTAIYGFGCPTLGHDIVKLKTTLRTKATWGAPETIANTEPATVKIADDVTGLHQHSISRNILWIRELWLEATVNEMFGFNEGHWRHTITGGFFPFQLGRGISLGAAYATDPDLLGYYSPSSIDQFAPGFKFSGEDTASKQIAYDLYVAILNNKSNTFSNVNMNILGQQDCRQFFPQRGFGVINWLFAARTKWYPIKNDYSSLVLEPYALYDRQREQKVAFIGDSEGKLGTIGLAFEAKIGNFEFGADGAANLGHQHVKGWDSNILQSEVRNGSFVLVNSDVLAIASNDNGDVAGKKALFTPANQAVINSSQRCESQNGQQIGGNSSNLQNSNDRFNDPYTNRYKGFMVVGDMAYIFFNGFKMSFGGGYSSGDENPNRSLELADGTLKNVDYKGFVGLQEIYSGTRIRSAFVLSGEGRIPRLLSFPSPDLEDPFPVTVSRFTNIAFVGWSALFEGNRWSVNPNILNYWQTHVTRLFNTASASAGSIPLTSARPTSKWLGVETNLFSDFKLFDDIRFFFIGSVFIPGTHFKDISGLPLSKAQQKFLNSQNDTGNDVEFVPTVGHNTAYTINFGVEYKF